MRVERQQKDLAHSVVITAMGTAFPPVAALVTAPLLAQGLGLEARGQVAAAQAVSVLTVSLMAFGLPEALTYFVARRALARSRASRAIVAFTISAGALACCATYFLAGWLGDGNDLTVKLIRFASVAVVPALILGLVRGRAAGHERWGQIAAERIIGSGARMVGAVLLLVTGHLTPMTATALIVFTPLLGISPYLVRAKTGVLVAQRSASGVREVASYSARTWIGAVSGILLMRIDQALLVPLGGVTALGLYTVAVSISEVPLVVNSAIRDVTFARHSGAFDELRLVQAARASLLLTGLLATCLAVATPWGVPTLFGSDFKDAVPVTLLLLLAVVIGTPGSIAGAALSATGRPELRSYSLMIAAAVNIGALCLLAPLWGAMGAAVATMIGNIISSNLNIYWFNRRRDTTWTSFYSITNDDCSRTVRSGIRFASLITSARGRDG